VDKTRLLEIATAGAAAAAAAIMVPAVLQGVLVQVGKVTMVAQHSVLNSLLAVAVALVQPEVMLVTQSGVPEAQVLLRR